MAEEAHITRRAVIVGALASTAVAVLPAIPPLPRHEPVMYGNFLVVYDIDWYRPRPEVRHGSH